MSPEYLLQNQSAHRFVGASRRATVVDFEAVRTTKIRKPHQVLCRNLLILREENWVGNLVPNRVPERMEPVDLSGSQRL
jgi:hypothetical protein